MTTTADPPRPTAPLRGTGFFRLWIGDFVSNTGSSMITFIVPVIGVTVLGLSAVQVSWVVAAGLAAPLFVALSAGVVADRADRTLLLHLCNIGRLAAFVLVLVLLLAGSLTWPILALVLFVVGALTLLYESAMAAAIPAVVPARSLVRANSWIEGGLSVTESAGPAGAGALLSALGAPFIVAINAATYLFSSIMLVGLPLGRRPDVDEAATSQRGILREHLAEIALGFRLIWRQAPQRVVLLAATVYNFFDSWILAVFAVYALQILDMSPALLGLVFVLPVVVGIVGSVFADRVTRAAGLGKTLTASFGLIAVAGLALPLAGLTSGVPAAVIVSVVFAVFEICIVINLIIGRTMRQALFPAQHLSKVAGTARFVSWGVDPVGALAGGAVAGLLGLQASVAFGSAGFVICALICLSSPALRAFRALPADA